MLVRRKARRACFVKCERIDVVDQFKTPQGSQDHKNKKRSNWFRTQITSAATARIAGWGSNSGPPPGPEANASWSKGGRSVGLAAVAVDAIAGGGWWCRDVLGGEMMMARALGPVTLRKRWCGCGNPRSVRQRIMRVALVNLLDVYLYEPATGREPPTCGRSPPSPLPIPPPPPPPPRSLLHTPHASQRWHY